MVKLILKNGVLNDDVVYIAENGKVFKGNFVAIIEYYTFLNEWNNKKHYKSFKTLENLYKFIDKNYKNVTLEY